MQGERKVADWLFDHGVEYEYEPKRFTFNKNYSYLPDFYIPRLDLYIEVKGWMKPRAELLHRLFINRSYELLIIDDIKRADEILSKEVPSVAARA